jgi:hypothetical protein
MGRKKIDEPREALTAMVKPSSKKEVIRLAEKIGISPSLLAANLIDLALDDALAIERLGFLKIGLFSRDITKKLKEKIYKGGDIEIGDLQQE